MEWSQMWNIAADLQAESGETARLRKVRQMELPQM
jgi:hypothetical protein